VPAFLRLILISFKQETTYRTAMWAGLATNLFFGLLRAYLMIALFQQRGEVNGMNVLEAVTYIAVSQSMIVFTRGFGSYDLMQAVYSGVIGSDLLRPVRIFTYWLARDIGRSIFQFFGRGVLFLLIFGMWFKLTLPGNLAGWVCFFISLLLAWMVSFNYRFLTNLISFWVPDAQGAARAVFGSGMLLSGFLFPLRLLPDWFSNLCHLTFFPALYHTPIDIFLGNLQGSDLYLALAIQAGWGLALFAGCQLALAAGLKRLVVQGG